MRLFAVILTILFLTFPALAKEPSSLHLLLDEQGELVKSSGSGTHLGNGIVLTASHVVLSSHNLGQVNNKMIEAAKEREIQWESDGAKGVGYAIWIDPKRDVALIKITDYDQIESSHLVCTDPKVGDKLSISAFPMYFGRVLQKDLPVIAPAIKREGSPFDFKYFIVTVNTIPGMSGGGLMNDKGEVVGTLNAFPGLNQFISFPTMGIAVPASEICNSIKIYKNKKGS